MLTVVAACFFILVGSGGSAHAETRTLKLYNTHTHERVSITFKKNGRYIQSGLRELNRFLRDWRRNESTKMDPELFDLVWEVYQQSGSNKHIHVVSGYRSPATNNMLRSRSRGVAKKSQHTFGKAMDFYIPGVNISTLRKIGLRKEIGGVGYYPKSGSPFVHLDTGRVRHWPRMTRSQLAGVFPDGVTLHVPTDGKPMPGYKTALARHKSGRAGTVTVASNNAPTTRDQVLSNVSSDDGGLVRPGASQAGKGFLASLFSDEEEEDEASASEPQSEDTRTRVAATNPGGRVPPQPLPGVRAASAQADEPAAKPAAAASAVADVAEPPVPERKIEDQPAEEDRIVVAGIYPKSKPLSPALVARADANPNSLDAQLVRLKQGAPAQESTQESTQVASLEQPSADRFSPKIETAPRVKPEDVLAAAAAARSNALPQAAPPRDGVAAIAAATGGNAKQPSLDRAGLSDTVLAYGAANAPAELAPAATGKAVASTSNQATARQTPRQQSALSAAKPSISGSLPAPIIRDPLARFAALPDRKAVTEFISSDTSTRTAAFARFSHPDQRKLKELFLTGDRVLPDRFQKALNGPRTDRFSGEAVVLLPMLSLR